MPLIGYARVSTEDQITARQLDELRAAGCAEILEEHPSGVGAAALRINRCAVQSTAWLMPNTASVRAIDQVVRIGPIRPRQIVQRTQRCSVVSHAHKLLKTLGLAQQAIGFVDHGLSPSGRGTQKVILRFERSGNTGL